MFLCGYVLQNLIHNIVGIQRYQVEYQCRPEKKDQKHVFGLEIEQVRSNISLKLNSYLILYINIYIYIIYLCINRSIVICSV